MPKAALPRRSSPAPTRERILDAASELLARDGGAAVTLRGVAKAAKLTHYRVDATHSHAYAAWRRLGSPLAPNREQYDRLRAASELASVEDAPATIPVNDGKASLSFSLPRQGVSLLVLDCSP